MLLEGSQLRILSLMNGYAPRNQQTCIFLGEYILKLLNVSKTFQATSYQLLNCTAGLSLHKLNIMVNTESSSCVGCSPT